MKIEITPPKDNSWNEVLRFYCQTSPDDNPLLEFMATMWSFSISKGCLTDKHAESALKYLQHQFNTMKFEYDYSALPKMGRTDSQVTVDYKKTRFTEGNR